MGAGASCKEDARFTDEEKALMEGMPMGHDLTQAAEHERYMTLYSKGSALPADPDNLRF